MGMLQEFRTFAVKGNVVDMAVGIVIGAAFGKIVSSLVEGVVMPPIGMLVGGVDFSQLGYVLAPPDGIKPPVVLAWGRFLQTVVDFTIVAFAMFMMVKVMNRLKRQEEAAPPPPAPPTAEVELLTEIRDVLKARA